MWQNQEGRRESRWGGRILGDLRLSLWIVYIYIYILLMCCLCGCYQPCGLCAVMEQYSCYVYCMYIARCVDFVLSMYIAVGVSVRPHDPCEACGIYII
jgi:hypothetical protein